MSKDTIATNSPKNPVDKQSTIDFRFGKDSKIQPVGMDCITMDTEVTVMLKGKITSFSSGELWDEGKRFSLKMSSCEIMKPPAAKEPSLDNALKSANESRKKV